MAQRGQLTEDIKNRAIEVLMRPIDQDELDLMRHAMQCALSGRSLTEGITGTSQGDALARWVAAGWVWGEEGNLRLVREFWEICAQLVWDAYCAPDVDLPA
jgi:hypothetical protein